MQRTQNYVVHLDIRKVEEVYRQQFISWFKDKVKIILYVIKKM